MKDLQVLQQTMTSLEVAELTGKEHRDVLRDIRVIIDSSDIGADLHTSFKQDFYSDSYGRQQPCYTMNRLGTLLLITGYDVNARWKLLKRWEELETENLISKGSLSKFGLELIKTMKLDKLNRLKAMDLLGFYTGNTKSDIEHQLAITGDDDEIRPVKWEDRITSAALGRMFNMNIGEIMRELACLGLVNQTYHGVELTELGELYGKYTSKYQIYWHPEVIRMFNYD